MVFMRSNSINKSRVEEVSHDWREVPNLNISSSDLANLELIISNYFDHITSQAWLIEPIVHQGETIIIHHQLSILMTTFSR